MHRALEHEWNSRARLLAVILLLVGLAWRFIRYGLGFPLWGDEAALMTNVVERQGYSDLLRPLDHTQVAPLGFLVAQYAVVQHLGTSEHALRLFPLFTSVAALCLFARLAWLALPPLAAACAIGVMAATHYVTRYSLDIKPYGTDMMAASALLLLAVHWLRRPAEKRWLAMLTVAAPVAIVLSYPAIFVAGAIALWAPTILSRRRSTIAEWITFITFVSVILVSFLISVHLWAGGQFIQTKDAMLLYWARGLPPANPLWFVVWLFDVHTAEMMAYPVGGKNGASVIASFLCLVGIHFGLRRGERSLLLLLGLVFALTFVAAVARRYPYGGSARVAQHLAPAICLFIGAGIEGLVRRFRTAEGQRRGIAIAGAILLLVAVGGMVRDVVYPHHALANRQIQTMLDAWRRDRLADSGMWVTDAWEQMPWTVQWYLLRGVDFARAMLYEGTVRDSRASQPGGASRGGFSG